MTDGDEFYEDDEPVEQMAAAFNHGIKGVTRRPPVAYGSWYCEHMTIAGPLIGETIRSSCGCVMRRIPETKAS